MKKAIAKLTAIAATAKSRIENKLSNNDGGTDGFVAALVLIIIVVAVGIIFKGTISSFFSDAEGGFFGQVTNNMNSLWS